MRPTRSSEERSAGRGAEWEEALALMGSCTRCHLSTTRRSVVIYRGSAHPKVLFIGESPGKKEDELGIPFVGAAGRVLDKGMSTLSLRPADYGITNVFMCRPPGNKFDKKAALACREWFELKLRLLKPLLYVTLGSHALASLEPGAGPIMTVAGTPMMHDGTPLVPLLHPAASLRNRHFRERWESDLSHLNEFLPSILKSLDALK